MTITELRDTLDGPSPEYIAKQMHAVPDAPVVSREAFILERCKGKVVLDIGASGPMHAAIKEVASKVYGIDRPDGAEWTFDETDYGERWLMDLDAKGGWIPKRDDVEVISCGEVIEHLSNPGMFLESLKHAYTGIPVIITVPNAFAEVGRKHLERGTECVNLDHVAYYSYRTLRELLRRAGYGIKEFYWYRGRPRFSEGLIVVTE